MNCGVLLLLLLLSLAAAFRYKGWSYMSCSRCVHSFPLSCSRQRRVTVAQCAALAQARTCSASLLKLCIMLRMPFSQTLWFSNMASELVTDAPSPPSPSPSSAVAPSCSTTPTISSNLQCCSGRARLHLRHVHRHRRVALERRVWVLQKVTNCSEGKGLVLLGGSG
jgi:hypothetical protein